MSLKILNNDELIVSHTDYARLRALSDGHPLDAELDRAIVVPGERMPPDIVAMHSRVHYLDESSGTRRQIDLVYPHEANLDDGRISVLAPVGSALLGLAVGGFIDWKYPGGEIRRLRIEAVEPAPALPDDQLAPNDATARLPRKEERD